MTARDFKLHVLPVSNKLLRFAVQFLKDEEQAKDAVQDVFLKLWQKRDGLAKVENMEAFAMRILRNRCLDIIRLNRFVPVEDDKLRRLSGEKSDPDREMDLSETALLVRDAIGKLPEVQRQVMWLRDIEQMDYEEIAGITDLEINALRVNLSRARKKVRDELLKYQDYGTGRSENTVAKIF
ncbi:MAG: sigma-70 family RNA polymerase sigma factor [Prolixibacteraceae bacterium]|jgi:RNA polymerase sigma-70 factor (ECF subfamily)|nr:sigma-70 family RNA polymerase sigma factor [Prolixibacteraceae bacterium]